jgi:hypothetical protein
MTESVYDIATLINNFTTQVALIDGVFLREDMRRLSPMTALFATNDGWANKVISLDDISKSVLENMIFEDLLWCEVLRNKAASRTNIESLNGQSWVVTVNDQGMPCFDTLQVFGGPTFKACVTRCDILAKNGIAHELDNIMLFKSTETIGPQAPVMPVARQPSAPTWNVPTISSSGGDNSFQSPSYSGSFGAGGSNPESAQQADGTSSAMRYGVYLSLVFSGFMAAIM